jgi:hypothetical protein
MKKISILFIISIFFLSCSSSDDNTNDNVYFNFTFDGRNYSSTVDGGFFCMIAVPSQSGSEVSIVMNHNNPSNNTTTCGVTIHGINNIIGTTNNCSFSLISGDDWIKSSNTKVILTEVGDFYVGTFSGNIIITDFNSYYETIPGSGSFRVRKSI